MFFWPIKSKEFKWSKCFSGLEEKNAVILLGIFLPLKLLLGSSRMLTLKTFFNVALRFVNRLVCILAEKSQPRFVNRIDDFLNKSLSKMPSWLKCYNYK